MRFILFFLFILISFITRTQLCGTSINKGTINLTNIIQYTTPTGANKRIIYFFNAKKGCNYIFSTIGLTTQDSEITILKDTTFAIVGYNDDYNFSLQSHINFYCNQTGGYAILITRWNNGYCKVLSEDIRFSAIRDCGIVMGYEPEEEVEVIIIKEKENKIIKLFELDGREVALDSKGILIAEYADKTKKIINIK